ncbi:MAG TPA: ATP-binding protein [Pyrinomonadaceae bacterium]
MSPLDILQLVGYSIGALLPLWMAVQLVSHRDRLTALERILFALALTMGGWHTSNLFITLHRLFGFKFDRGTDLLRLADTVAVISITFAYSFLLHVHLHLWANAHNRGLTRSEKIRVYLSYLPTIFLALAIPRLWTGAYAPMFIKLSGFVFPFAFWIAYVLGLIAVTELLIARHSKTRSEQRIMRTLAASFIGIGIVIMAALALGLGEGTVVGVYLKTVANLGSLLPSVLLAYYIYRYRYLEIIIEESLIVVTFATVVLSIYIFGIRTIGDWFTSHYGVRPGLVEALLILALTLGAAPLRGWLQQRFHKLFEREAALYRQIVSRIGSHAGQYRQLSELLKFVEERTSEALGFRQVRILINSRPDLNGSGARGEGESWLTEVLDISRQGDWQPVEDEQLLTSRGYRIALPLRREDKIAGMMVVDTGSAGLTTDSRSVLGLLADQVAIAIDDSRLVEENVRLEIELAESERLAALGQMAATVAHEIKNPLSAIKSIAQVMREDQNLSKEYARDLSLIVGETDRLSNSVTQLLSFARKDTPDELPLPVSELVRSVVGLFQASANEQNVKIVCDTNLDRELTGKAVAAIRDALSNLILNALQSTPAGGSIRVSAALEKVGLLLVVQDSGPGVPAGIRDRIWEPFFTTKQRGTGLGLAIVRKRMQEAGGSALLSSAQPELGARFELRVALNGDTPHP